MKIEFDIEPIVDAVANMPTWGIVLAIAHVWYGAFGYVFKRIMRENPYRWKGEPFLFVIWVISPILFPLWTAGWVSSLGFIPPPWKKSNWVQV